MRSSRLLSVRGRGNLPAQQMLTPLLQTRYLATQGPAQPATTNYRVHGLLALSLFSASIGLFVWERRTAGVPVMAMPTSETFTVRAPTSRGVQEFSFSRKHEAVIESMLHENETSQTIGRQGNPVKRWDRNWVGCNEPPEDRSAIDNIARPLKVTRSGWLGQYTSETHGGEGSRDITLFSVIDGHGGDETSKLLAKALHPTLSLALASLQAGHGPFQATGMKAAAEYLNPLTWVTGTKWSPENVVLSVQNALVTMTIKLTRQGFYSLTRIFAKHHSAFSLHGPVRLLTTSTLLTPLLAKSLR